MINAMKVFLKGIVDRAKPCQIQPYRVGSQWGFASLESIDLRTACSRHVSSKPVGPRLVSPRTRGPRPIGPKLVSPKLVGPELVGRDPILRRPTSLGQN